MKLIVIDIGNTNVDVGFFTNGDLKSNAKISTKDNKSEFEIASTLQSLLKIDSNETDEIDIIISSVVPNKTVVVEVTRKFKHPFYEKIIKRSKKYHAHDEKNKFKEGEKVSIIESKPYSKKKTWQVIEK